jgi:hypothetical protein
MRAAFDTFALGEARGVSTRVLEELEAAYTLEVAAYATVIAREEAPDTPPHAPDGEEGETVQHPSGDSSKRENRS